MLRTLVRGLTGAAGLAVELRVLQYGVTRDSLREALEEGEGWDVVHFSGHGLPGSLALELPDGGHDLIEASEVADLLRQAGGRLKLVVLSACLSAAASIEQTLNWLGVATDLAAQRDASVSDPALTEEATKTAPTLAHALTTELDCAVLAMRYSVEDEFATVLAGTLYEGLFAKRQPLPRAAQLALHKTFAGDGAGASARAAVGAISAAAPALFGVLAVDLTLTPPRRSSSELVFEVPATSLASFPTVPPHFVGRVTAMTRASVAFAAEGDRSGVLFHGMAGAGKTSCAVELAYHHAAAKRFQAFVWYSAPEQGKDIALALRGFRPRLANRELLRLDGPSTAISKVTTRRRGRLKQQVPRPLPPDCRGCHWGRAAARKGVCETAEPHCRRNCGGDCRHRGTAAFVRLKQRAEHVPVG